MPSLTVIPPLLVLYIPMPVEVVIVPLLTVILPVPVLYIPYLELSIVAPSMMTEAPVRVINPESEAMLVDVIAPLIVYVPEDNAILLPSVSSVPKAVATVFPVLAKYSVAEVSADALTSVIRFVKLE